MVDKEMSDSSNMLVSKSKGKSFKWYNLDTQLSGSIKKEELPIEIMWEGRNLFCSR
jgi:hypothetical protein